MGRVALSLLVVTGALACRDPGDAPTIPGTTVGSDGGLRDAGGSDGFVVRPLGTRPPGSGGIPGAIDLASASCPDPVVGVWVAKTFATGPQRWHEHRLSITRDPDGDLSVDQTTRIWDGGPGDALPSLCPAGGPSWGVYRITDRGRFVDGILHVWGVDVRSSTHTCQGEIIGYNLDSFTGRVHRDAYTARNNDGEEAVNRPYAFRRIACDAD
jgi:hypothetical protein